MLGTRQRAFLGGESVLFALAGMEGGTVVAWVSTNGPVQAWNTPGHMLQVSLCLTSQTGSLMVTGWRDLEVI